MHPIEFVLTISIRPREKFIKLLMGLSAPSGSKAAGASPLGDSLRSPATPPSTSLRSPATPPSTSLRWCSPSAQRPLRDSLRSSKASHKIHSRLTAACSSSPVIPADAGKAKRASIPRERYIHPFQNVTSCLDPGVCRSDDCANRHFVLRPGLCLVKQFLRWAAPAEGAEGFPQQLP